MNDFGSKCFVLQSLVPNVISKWRHGDVCLVCVFETQLRLRVPSLLFDLEGVSPLAVVTVIAGTVTASVASFIKLVLHLLNVCGLEIGSTQRRTIVFNCSSQLIVCLWKRWWWHLASHTYLVGLVNCYCFTHLGMFLALILLFSPIQCCASFEKTFSRNAST